MKIEMTSSMSDAPLNPLDKCVRLNPGPAPVSGVPMANLGNPSPTTLLHTTPVFCETNVTVPPHSSQSSLFTPDGTAVEDFTFLNSPSLEWLLAQAQTGELPASWEVPAYEQFMPDESTNFLSELPFACPQSNLFPPPINLPAAYNSSLLPAAFPTFLAPSVAGTWPCDGWSTPLPNWDPLSEIFPEVQGVNCDTVPVADARGTLTQSIPSAGFKRKTMDRGTSYSEISSVSYDHPPAFPHPYSAHNDLLAFPDNNAPCSGLSMYPRPGPPGMRGLEGCRKRDFRRPMAEQSSCVMQGMTEFQEIPTNFDSAFLVTDATSARNGGGELEALHRLFARPEASPLPQMNVRTGFREQTWNERLMAIQHALQQPVSLEMDLALLSKRWVGTSVSTCYSMEMVRKRLKSNYPDKF